MENHCSRQWSSFSRHTRRVASEKLLIAGLTATVYTDYRAGICACVYVLRVSDLYHYDCVLSSNRACLRVNDSFYSTYLAIWGCVYSTMLLMYYSVLVMHLYYSTVFVGR